MVSPYFLGLGAVAGAAGGHDVWLLFCLPAIALGVVCTAPNLNLADGCLIQLLASVCLLFSCFFGAKLAVPGLVGWVAWLVAGIEAAARLRHRSRTSESEGAGDPGKA